jgi:hypothetical protein
MGEVLFALHRDLGAALPQNLRHPLTDCTVKTWIEDSWERETVHDVGRTIASSHWRLHCRCVVFGPLPLPLLHACGTSGVFWREIHL